MQENIQNRGKLDVKMENNGEVLSLNYSGEIQIITKEALTQLRNRARKVSDLEEELERLKSAHKKELDSLKENHQLELSRAQNELDVLGKRWQAKYNNLASDANSKLSAQQRKLQEAERFLNQKGQGRPQILTDQHKQFIENNLGHLKYFGGTRTIKDLEKELVYNHGYSGGYEAVRAFVSQLRRPGR